MNILCDLLYNFRFHVCLLPPASRHYPATWLWRRRKAGTSTLLAAME